MKPLPALILFLSGLLVGTALSWMALRPAPTAVPRPADDDARLRPQGEIEVPRAEIVDHDTWRQRGFALMTPPVRLPSDGAGRDQIAVWLGIPDGALIEAKRLDDGRTTLRFPPGTTADRVESFAFAKDDAGHWRWSVIDVRGTRTETDGSERFHVLVPAGPEPLARLIGWEWARGNAPQERAATSLLVAHLEATPATIHDPDQSQSDVQRRGFVEAYRRNNDCAKCHVHDKPAQTGPRQGSRQGPHRATDASGFYVPLSVLMDTVPLERHRARDMNVGDPFLTFTCPTGPAPSLAEGPGGARDFRCLEGGSPSATLDVKKALAANDERTLALCRSRAYLRDHMNDEARALFASAFTACGI